MNFQALLPVLLLSLVSGAISLGYQVMWFRIHAQRFGSTNLTFLLVLVCFIGGLGLGALVSRNLSRFASRLPRLANPIALVGTIEVAIALTALGTVLFDPSGLIAVGPFPYAEDSRGIFEPVLALRLEVAYAALAMLLPTFLMGTTFPILCHAFTVRSIFPSELYGWNTVGACTGVLAAEFLLLPTFGHIDSFYVLVGMNLLVGAGFAFVSRGDLAERGTLAPEVEKSQEVASPAKATAKARRRERRKAKTAPKPSAQTSPVFRTSVILCVAALSGFISGSLEVDMFRAVRFAGAITDAAMSFTSFWAIVAIFAASFTVRTLKKPRPLLIQLAIPGALLAHAVTWLSLPRIRGFFNQLFTGWTEAKILAQPSLAHATEVYPLSGSLLLLLGFTGVVVFPAYYLVSLLLPQVCNIVQSERNHVGIAYGLNTVAFCTGAVLFTWVFPGQSLFYAVKLLFVVLAASAFLALTFRPRKRVSYYALASAGVAVMLGIFLVPKSFDPSLFPANELPARYPVRGMKSNATHTTFVVEAPQGDMLFFDSHPMSGTGATAQRYMSLMAHFPLLAHPEPRNALLICFGVGNTARAIGAHRNVEAIDIVDLNDKVFETAPEFARTNGSVYLDPRVRLIHDDGRRFLKYSDEEYDLITSEPPPPRAQGVYRLYSVEYYREVLDHLTPRGMMTQWLPVNSLSAEATDRIIASFVHVFPHSLLFVGSGSQLILLGGREPFDAAILERRFEESPNARTELGALGMQYPIAVLARILRVGEALRRDVAGSRVISDERNDLALTVTDPFDPPASRFDPRAVISALRPERLQSGTQLAETIADPIRLRQVVPDFPSF